jgi:hypothetical protein
MTDEYNEEEQENIENHLNYLKVIFNRERDRDKILESKLSQIRGQSGIIITLTGFYLPLLSKFSEAEMNWLSYVAFIIVPLNIVLFAVSIYFSRKSLDISKYAYAASDENLVFEQSGISFLQEQVSDLIFIIKNNRLITNKKGTNLIWAHNFFYFGLIGILLLSFLFVLNLIPK